MIGEMAIRRDLRKRLNTHKVTAVFQDSVKCSCDQKWRKHMDHAEHVSTGLGNFVMKLIKEALLTKPPRTSVGSTLPPNPPRKAPSEPSRPPA